MAKKWHIRQVDAIAKQYGMGAEARRKFREHIHMLKNSGHKGSLDDEGNFTFQELDELARDMLGLDDA